jgi:hypothetical protein
MFYVAEGGGKLINDVGRSSESFAQNTPERITDDETNVESSEASKPRMEVEVCLFSSAFSILYYRKHSIMSFPT